MSDDDRKEWIGQLGARCKAFWEEAKTADLKSETRPLWEGDRASNWS